MIRCEATSEILWIHKGGSQLTHTVFSSFQLFNLARLRKSIYLNQFSHQTSPRETKDQINLFQRDYKIYLPPYLPLSPSVVLVCDARSDYCLSSIISLLPAAFATTSNEDKSSARSYPTLRELCSAFHSCCRDFELL